MPAEGTLAREGLVASADGTKLSYRAWPKAGATISLAVMHGLGEHSRRYERFAMGMARHGFATFAVDLRGHGKSEGRRGHVDSWNQWTDDVAAFVAHVEGLAGGEVVPVGHSFGGAALLSTLLAGKLPETSRLVLSSPALRLKSSVPGWKLALGKATSVVLPTLTLDNQVDPKTLSRIPEVVEAYRTDPLVHSKISSRLYSEWGAACKAIFERAGEIKVPFLILAGTDDKLIDPAGSEELHRRSKKASTLRIFDGRYHEPFNDVDSEEVFAVIADWLSA
ncbi:MAG: lysophospholipase [Chloroflexi bacterium]|nr:MAG: lysophospholipase [Chloroflexota bacterium]